MREYQVIVVLVTLAVFGMGMLTAKALISVGKNLTLPTKTECTKYEKESE